MEIRKVAFVTFRISFDNIDLLTDPIFSSKFVKNFPKTTGEVVLHSDSSYSGVENVLQTENFTKIEPKRRDSIVEINSAGQYEVGGVMVRRTVRKEYYIIDEGNIRIVYMGHASKSLNPDKLGDMGDVDVLILPVGDSDHFPGYDKLERVIKKADPTYLIPCGYKDSALKSDYETLKSKEEFIKHFGFTHVSEEKKLKVTSGVENENKFTEVVLLD